MFQEWRVIKTLHKFTKDSLSLNFRNDELFNSIYSFFKKIVVSLFRNKNKNLKELRRIMHTFETVLQKKLKNDFKTLLKCR